MNQTPAAGLTRKVLTSIAVAAVAATCMVSSGAGASAAGSHRHDVSSATKEWKGYTTTTAVRVPTTKEW